MATINLPMRMSLPNPDSTISKAFDRFSSSKYFSDFVFQSRAPRRKCFPKQNFAVRSMRVTEQSQHGQLTSQNGPLVGVVSFFASFLVFGIWVFQVVTDFDSFWFYSFCLLRKCGKQGRNWNFVLWVFLFLVIWELKL